MDLLAGLRLLICHARGLLHASLPHLAACSPDEGLSSCIQACSATPGHADATLGRSLNKGLQARVEILKIHMRDKQVSPDLDIRRLARACAGFTGAEIMGLMNRAAMIAVRARHKTISEDDMFQVHLLCRVMQSTLDCTACRRRPATSGRAVFTYGTALACICAPTAQ